jgi:protein-disulfide isomerase
LFEVRASESGGGGARQLRRGRWWVRIALALALVALIAGIVELATQEADDSPVQISGVGDAQRIFGGIAQEGDLLGAAGAPVTVTLFDDVQCSSCADHFTEVVPRLVEDLVRNDRAALSYRNYSFSSFPEELGFFGVEAAAEQGYAWHYAYLFFRSQDEAERRGIDEDFLRDVAGAILELDVEQWTDDYREGLEEDSAIRRRLAASEELGQELEIRAEPAVFIDGPRGNRLLQDSPSAARIEAAVEAVG